MHRTDQPETSDPTALTREHWDAQADAYDRAKARNAAYYEALKSLVDGAVDPLQRERVLDIGCGTGQILASLNPHEGVGLDLSTRMIQIARHTWSKRPELTFESADTGHGQIVSKFSAVICCDVLEHAADWRPLIQAAADASRPGAAIVFTTPNPLWAFPLWVLEKLRLKMPEGWHRYVHRRDVADELRQRGCEIRGMGTRLMIPARLLGLGAAASSAAERSLVLRGLGVIQYVVARKL